MNRINQRNETFAAASEAAPPFLKRDHGACSSIYMFPALPISSTASQADDNERFSYCPFAFSTYRIEGRRTRAIVTSSILFYLLKVSDHNFK